MQLPLSGSRPKANLAWEHLCKVISSSHYALDLGGCSILNAKNSAAGKPLVTGIIKNTALLLMLG
jgi:hypothetical protein